MEFHPLDPVSQMDYMLAESMADQTPRHGGGLGCPEQHVKISAPSLGNTPRP